VDECKPLAAGCPREEAEAAVVERQHLWGPLAFLLRGMGLGIHREKEEVKQEGEVEQGMTQWLK